MAFSSSPRTRAPAWPAPACRFRTPTGGCPDSLRYVPQALLDPRQLRHSVHLHRSPPRFLRAGGLRVRPAARHRPRQGSRRAATTNGKPCKGGDFCRQAGRSQSGTTPHTAWQSATPGTLKTEKCSRRRSAEKGSGRRLAETPCFRATVGRQCRNAPGVELQTCSSDTPLPTWSDCQLATRLARRYGLVSRPDVSVFPEPVRADRRPSTRRPRRETGKRESQQYGGKPPTTRPGQSEAISARRELVSGPTSRTRLSERQRHN